MATRLVASEHAGEMICPWPMERTTVAPGTPADAELGTLPVAAACCAAVIVWFGFAAACCTCLATASCAALLLEVLCESAVAGGVEVPAEPLACAVGGGCCWRPVSVARALLT